MNNINENWKPLSVNDVYQFFSKLAKLSDGKNFPKLTSYELEIWKSIEPYFEWNPFINGCPTEVQHAILVDNMTWKTSEGQTLVPGNMDTRHIFYCMRITLKRIADKQIKNSSEFIKIGDTLWPVANEWDRPFESDPFELDEDIICLMQIFHGYHAFYWELERRRNNA